MLFKLTEHPAQSISGIEVRGDGDFVDRKFTKPMPQTEFGAVEEMIGRFVEWLHECRVERDTSARLQASHQLRRNYMRRVVVLESVYRNDGIEDAILEGQGVCIGDDVCVAVEARFDLDDIIELLLGAAGTQVQHEPGGSVDYFLSKGRERVAKMIVEAFDPQTRKITGRRPRTGYSRVRSCVSI